MIITNRQFEKLLLYHHNCENSFVGYHQSSLFAALAGTIVDSEGACKQGASS